MVAILRPSRAHQHYRGEQYQNGPFWVLLVVSMGIVPMYKDFCLFAYLCEPVYNQAHAPSPFISYRHHIVEKSYVILS